MWIWRTFIVFINHNVYNKLLTFTVFIVESITFKKKRICLSIFDIEIYNIIIFNKCFFFSFNSYKSCKVLMIKFKTVKNHLIWVFNHRLIPSQLQCRFWFQLQAVQVSLSQYHSRFNSYPGASAGPSLITSLRTSHFAHKEFFFKWKAVVSFWSLREILSLCILFYFFN